ncbi:hypothetical protein IFM89_025736 [Coptis chinensis]|uniref:UBC core domain-containing protein n=1 Tax=Coptis chinensis TaxID=261450 RepID=A0A835I5B2_9MAGN|nr:hypothetical protein IFM89_025736 [Coptis chinensis]
METAVSSSAASDSIANKKLKYSITAEEALTPDMVASTSTDPDSMVDDTMDLQNDSDLELDDLDDDASDASSYYDDDDDFSYYDETLSLQAQFDAADLPPGVEASVPWLDEHEEKQKLGANLPSEASLAARSSPLTVNGVTEEEEDIMFREFKSFDTVQDFTDHHFCKQASPAKRPGKDWAKAIQNDWRILEKDLPETIFVRVYEERMDLLRAVIIGAAGTPYHDGLFFFDVFFPSEYPKVAPHFEYFVGGHFRLRAQTILEACKEYIKGTEVGGLIEHEGEVQEGELQEITYDNIGSKNFRRSLGIVVGNLIPALLKNGAKDCEKYIPLGDVTRTAPLKI